MRHSLLCSRMVANFEGVRLVAYQDQGGVWTIGAGHTQDVHPDESCTYDQALAWLEEDLTAEDLAIGRLVKVPLTQNQWDALVSFAYNEGAGRLRTSTLLRLLNAGDFAGAAEEFGKWVYVNGVENPGLARRRAAERALFVTT